MERSQSRGAGNGTQRASGRGVALESRSGGDDV